MGISVVGKNVRGKVPTWRSFIADTEEDINILPIFPSVAYGSECFCTDNGNVYILEVNNNWVLKKESAAGSSLPEVTDADNGKVLTVIDGEWNKGYSTNFIINLTTDETTGDWVSDKTPAEIFEAFNNGRNIILKTETNDLFFPTNVTETGASFSSVIYSYDNNMGYGTSVVVSIDGIEFHNVAWEITPDD